MQLNITGHHIELTEALHAYVTEKFQRIERHFDHITHAQVILSVEKQRQKAEAKLQVSGGDIFAQDEQEDMYASIDAMIDKLDRQVIKYKEKMKSHK